MHRAKHRNCHCPSPLARGQGRVFHRAPGVSATSMGAQHGAGDTLGSDWVFPRAIPLCLNNPTTKRSNGVYGEWPLLGDRIFSPPAAFHPAAFHHGQRQGWECGGRDDHRLAAGNGEQPQPRLSCRNRPYATNSLQNPLRKNPTRSAVSCLSPRSPSCIRRPRAGAKPVRAIASAPPCINPMARRFPLAA